MPLSYHFSVLLHANRRAMHHYSTLPVTALSMVHANLPPFLRPTARLQAAAAVHRYSALLQQ